MGTRFNRVLFVRVDDELLRMLDRLVEKHQKANPQNPVSRSRLVRDLLWDEVRAELKAWEDGGRGT